MSPNYRYRRSIDAHLLSFSLAKYWKRLEQMIILAIIRSKSSSHRPMFVGWSLGCSHQAMIRKERSSARVLRPLSWCLLPLIPWYQVHSNTGTSLLHYSIWYHQQLGSHVWFRTTAVESLFLGQWQIAWLTKFNLWNWDVDFKWFKMAVCNMNPAKSA